jgi:hypothetical protein
MRCWKRSPLGKPQHSHRCTRSLNAVCKCKMRTSAFSMDGQRWFRCRWWSVDSPLHPRRHRRRCLTRDRLHRPHGCRFGGTTTASAHCSGSCSSFAISTSACGRQDHCCPSWAAPACRRCSTWTHYLHWPSPKWYGLVFLLQREGLMALDPAAVSAVWGEGVGSSAASLGVCAICEARPSWRARRGHQRARRGPTPTRGRRLAALGAASSRGKRAGAGPGVGARRGPPRRGRSARPTGGAWRLSRALDAAHLGARRGSLQSTGAGEGPDAGALLAARRGSEARTRPQARRRRRPGGQASAPPCCLTRARDGPGAWCWATEIAAGSLMLPGGGWRRLENAPGGSGYRGRLGLETLAAPI